ncbi:MAG TPA: hypothetical protein VI306_23360 [Pyrinomonadaceae bacterium]
MRKLTLVLLILFTITLIVSFVRRRDSLFTGYAASQKNSNAERASKANRAFPVAQFDETDPNSEQGRQKKEKRQRYNAWHLVVPKPAPWVSEATLSSEGYLDFPALPVTESDAILIATVATSEAHVSENKRGVFSEFNLAVESVLKNHDELKEGSLLSVDRVGGYVKYPNGQQVLFKVNGVNMPEVGMRYLFFLSAKRKPDVTILTAYALTNEGIAALDFSSQFLSLDGLSETEIRKRIQDLLTK